MMTVVYMEKTELSLVNVLFGKFSSLLNSFPMYRKYHIMNIILLTNMIL